MRDDKQSLTISTATLLDPGFVSVSTNQSSPPFSLAVIGWASDAVAAGGGRVVRLATCS